MTGKQFAALYDVLILQYEALAALREALLPHDDTTIDVCDHPEARRVDLSSFGDTNHWVCAVCKFDNKRDTVMN